MASLLVYFKTIFPVTFFKSAQREREREEEKCIGGKEPRVAITQRTFPIQPHPE